VLRFGHKRKWEGAKEKYAMKTYNIHILFLSLHITSVMRSKGIGRTGLVECTGEIIDSFIILIGRAEGKRPLARTSCRRGDNF
jgi:hypothetical protein